MLSRYRLLLREERRRLACLRVLLQAPDDPAPRVVDRREILRRQLSGPAFVAERHLVAAVLRRLDLPGHGRAVPLRETAVRRPADALSRFELVDIHLQHRSVEAEPG